ncbi:MAG TPA: phosphatidylserine/phosphatidylglycerophosphate/cardiolipin synthase family protein [Pyrinomonadaceae bacterium]|nr:phosphatidylserine/phosphatidylglycerophosphate/cardiolipin synthase family protein [Pyrinomonadaceae bacterium]
MLAVVGGIEYNPIDLNMAVELLVNFHEFWARLREDIAQAQGSIWIQTFAFEGDSVGQELADAVLAAPAQDKRILADSFTRVVLSDRFRYSPSNLFDKSLRSEAGATERMRCALKAAGVAIKFTNPFGASPRKLLSRNHKKLIVVDDSAAYIGGINFSEHNAAWHDMMLRIDDSEAISFLRNDFQSSWEGRDQSASAQFDGLELLLADGRQNGNAFGRIIELIDGARKSIVVESPYVTFPFYERLRAATRRGVGVTIITPEQNNWRFFANYARLESARSGVDLRLFQGMSHLKAMLIDDEYLVCGSSNFDYLSYRIHQELIAVITTPDVIADFRARVMLPDLANARSVEGNASAIGQRWLSWQTKLIDAAVTTLT